MLKYSTFSALSTGPAISVFTEIMEILYQRKRQTRLVAADWLSCNLVCDFEGSLASIRSLFLCPFCEGIVCLPPPNNGAN
ncbi:hypothetical protein LENED_005775 [Lentinula edodes]|uniref:Uncharacterized protein n=1 Tax=Lentinula edodes TaxID=5353 RepID=A0A1Q3E9X4_LENED|nr:hypothetical protein LENED_005775 [Lentinula edodes]